jgi:peptidoglycan hydrolase CwlO-like protein
MSLSDANYRELITKIAQLEYRISKVENAQGELEKTMTPGGYITEAFERVYQDIDKISDKIDEQNKKIDEQNKKIDIILLHITGQGNST